MTIVNHYHGCEIVSSDDQLRHTVHRDGRLVGTFDTLAAAIRAARRHVAEEGACDESTHDPSASNDAAAAEGVVVDIAVDLDDDASLPATD